MHRQQLLQLLNEYTTEIQDEKEMFEQLLQFVQTQADCFKRC
jgi:hypothetical protein